MNALKPAVKSLQLQHEVIIEQKLCFFVTVPNILILCKGLFAKSLTRGVKGDA